MNEDIRWKQRLVNFKKAFALLNNAIDKNGLNPICIIREGIIHRFEFTHELAWKLMKDFLEYEGIQNITGSRSATREAFNKGLILDGDTWMDMIESRNKTVHTYQQDILETEYANITNRYFVVLNDFLAKMNTL
ncbi:MAG: nucleotidyltransferase substrate binding protein [Pseudarcicella sp.]|nr:nucleotidyltransferase substrate binding protein [Pseudarcicella sp.]MBP6411420.1 nucleotidyltransferase substrate binding protein [Pseudarcicella sp.]